MLNTFNARWKHWKYIYISFTGSWDSWILFTASLSVLHHTWQNCLCSRLWFRYSQRNSKMFWNAFRNIFEVWHFFISLGEINSCPNVCSLMSLCGNKAAAWKWYKQTKDIGGKKVIKVRIPDSNQYLQNIYKNFFKKHTVFLKTVTPASYCQWRKSWCGTVALSNNYICILLITCVVYKRAM